MVHFLNVSFQRNSIGHWIMVVQRVKCTASFFYNCVYFILTERVVTWVLRLRDVESLNKIIHVLQTAALLSFSSTSSCDFVLQGFT